MPRSSTTIKLRLERLDVGNAARDAKQTLDLKVPRQRVEANTNQNRNHLFAFGHSEPQIDAKYVWICCCVRSVRACEFRETSRVQKTAI